MFVSEKFGLFALPFVINIHLHPIVSYHHWGNLMHWRKCFVCIYFFSPSILVAWLGFMLYAQFRFSSKLFLVFSQVGSFLHGVVIFSSSVVMCHCSVYLIIRNDLYFQSDLNYWDLELVIICFWNWSVVWEKAGDQMSCYNLAHVESFHI